MRVRPRPPARTRNARFLIKQDGAYARMWDAYTHRTEKKESLA